MEQFSDGDEVMGFLTEEQRLSIPELYKSGKSTMEIGKILGCSGAAISANMKKLGVTTRNRSEASRKYSLDESAFSSVSDESAYWIGFLMADGCIFENSIQVGLSEVDVDHLEKLKGFLKSEHPISKITPKPWHGYQSKPSVRLHISSEKISNDLARYGIIPRKSLNAIALCDVEKNPNFIRGILDGDGSISIMLNRKKHNGRVYEYKYPCVQIVGSNALMTQYLEFVKTVVPNCPAKVKKSKSIFSVALMGRSAFKLIEVVYKDAKISLDRKQKTANLILRLGYGFSEKKIMETD